MASILETFYILFKTNSDDVEKGIKKSSNALNTFENDALKAEAVVGAAGEYIGHIFEYVATRIASAFAIEEVARFVGSISEVNAELGLTAERLDVSVEDLGAWQQAVTKSGGSAQGFNSTLDELNRNLARVAATGNSRLKPFFDELGIRLTSAPHQARPLFDVLGDLADKFSKMDRQKAAGIGEALMLDPGTVLMLQKGRTAVEELVAKQKLLGVATEEDAKKAHEYRIALEDLQQQVRYLGTEIGSSVLPVLEHFFEWMGKIVTALGNHKIAVEAFFIGVALAITTAYLPAMAAAVAETLALIIEWALIVVPILLIGAALALVADDVKHFMDGNRSMIGELSEKYPKLGETVKNVLHGMSSDFKLWADDVQGSMDLVRAALNLSVTVWDKTTGAYKKRQEEIDAASKKTWPGVTADIEKFTHVLEALEKAVERIFGKIAKYFLGAQNLFPKTLEHWADSLNDVSVSLGGTRTPTHNLNPDRGPEPTVKPIFLTPFSPVASLPQFEIEGQPSTAGGIMNRINAVIAGAKGSQAAADRSPLNSITHNAGASSNVAQTVNVGPITVNVSAPGADAREIAGHVETHLRNSLRQAVDQHDDGVQN